MIFCTSQIKLCVLCCIDIIVALKSASDDVGTNIKAMCNCTTMLSHFKTDLCALCLVLHHTVILRTLTPPAPQHTHTLPHNAIGQSLGIQARCIGVGLNEIISQKARLTLGG